GRPQQFFFVFFIFMMSLPLLNAQKLANLAMSRKLPRLCCHQRRCMPLHS
uniref:Uncharacterized protein n=1 Tax=Rhinolophus ferrumequinum TaxID=59479 RepID=A0A671FD14_RHIFE